MSNAPMAYYEQRSKLVKYISQLVGESALRLERDHFFHNFLQRDRLSPCLCADIVSVPDVDAAGVCLLRTDSEDEVVLRNLGIADLLIQRDVRKIDLAVDASIPKRLHDLLRIGFVRSRDRHNNRLPR